jgi:Predicted restriction endonuclease
MQYWWVNQNQTFKQERVGSYLWSPKRKADGNRNPFYEFMREVAPGDLVFSFEGTYIRAISVVKSYCYECPKPIEFSGAGPNWNDIGWKVDVHYIDLIHQVRPADHINKINPVLPSKYSPLQSDGRGMQGVYLTEVPESLMQVLADLIGREAKDIINMSYISDGIGQYGQGLLEWEEHISQQIINDTGIEETQKSQIILARRGQGMFRSNVQRLEVRCRVTKVDRAEHLRASHCKPWRDCENSDERLDGENGLLLTPSIDHLFDRGFISFEDNGRLLVSPVAHKISMQRMGVPTAQTVNVGNFSEGQRKYLEFHRNYVFLEAMHS